MQRPCFFVSMREPNNHKQNKERESASDAKRPVLRMAVWVLSLGKAKTTSQEKSDGFPIAISEFPYSTAGVRSTEQSVVFLWEK